jgi:dihydrolipoamide dehydrogenase
VPGVEIDRKRIITSDEAIALREVPKSMIILGSGAVRRRVRVNLPALRKRGDPSSSSLPRIVPVEDEAISAELAKSFKKQGIAVHTGTKVTRATASATGVEVEAQLPDGKLEAWKADYLLVATGRGPVTQGLNAEGLGLNMDRGYIAVDNLFRTGVPGMSAVGDVISFGAGGTPHPQLAHVSSAEGIVAAERIAGHDAKPSTTITCPPARIAILKSAASG